MKIIKASLLISIFIILSLYSCKKEYTAPPELPPEASFITDFSDFNHNKAEGDSTNWKFAAENIGLWDTLVTIRLAIPIASYIEAFNNTPVYQSDNTWLWEYSFSDFTKNTYTAKLYGTLNTETIDWEMFISKEETYLDFLWFIGISKVDRSGADWVIFDNPNSATELLSIKYNNNSDHTENIKYMNITPADVKTGTYILYGNDGAGDFNTYFLIYNKIGDNITEVEWNPNLKNGRVKDESKFKNTDWHCWGENLQDIGCN